jgi:hypothetical protein
MVGTTEMGKKAADAEILIQSEGGSRRWHCYGSTIQNPIQHG